LQDNELLIIAKFHQSQAQKPPMKDDSLTEAKLVFSKILCFKTQGVQSRRLPPHSKPLGDEQISPLQLERIASRSNWKSIREVSKITLTLGKP
jgi:hypothetical protein